MASTSSTTFPVLPIQKFAGRNAPVRRPTVSAYPISDAPDLWPSSSPGGDPLALTLTVVKEITHFSYDNAHKLRHDHSSLKTYYTPRLDDSLSGGFESFVKHDDSVDEHLDGLLEALVELERKTGERVKADIVTWRGMMTKFMTLPFDLRNGFEMNAIKFQDTIFIEENHAYKQSSRGRSDARQDLMSFWGYKFETLSTLPTNWDDCPRELIENRDNEVVSNEAQFCSIVKTGFGDVRIVIGGEVDAVWNSNPPAPSTPPIYVELKTSKSPSSQRDDIAFERKLLRFWSQSFLLGVAKIIVGFRDDNGFLRSLQEFETQSLPGIAKRSGRGLWDGKLSIDFTASLLEWVKGTVSAEEEGVVWRVRWKSNGENVECVRTEDSSFLSRGFVAWREELAAKKEC